MTGYSLHSVLYEEIQRAVLNWFEATARDLPWRYTRDPYRILVAEVMLQQTQVDRVLPRYHAFLQVFPTLAQLAAASPAEVIREWSGLGYNRRAVNLQRTARIICDEYNGQFPRDVASLKHLPGIGPYTAGAIACFAFEQDVAFLDTNIRRVVRRCLIGAEMQVPEVAERDVLALARELLPAGQGWLWNQAIMELGACICGATAPACDRCPIQQHCQAYAWWNSAERLTLIEQDDTQQAPGRVFAYKPRVQRRVAEQRASYAGSNRYYRGKLIATLRTLNPGEVLSLTEIGEHIKDDYSVQDAQWLRSLVEGLAQDRLVEIVGNGVRLPL